ncbi:MAG: hypothetical protein H6708_18400 [Kofleriaceae bacterium]|nr:hypothetical protein [Kofleriaceae bacterium]
MVEARLPGAPGAFAPSLMAMAGPTGAAAVDGDNLSDADTCATCHPDVAEQWSASAHSFASFNNPVYRANVQLIRDGLGKAQSQHCGGCHDASLEIDGLMLGDIPAEDLRAHSGVTCRLCHGIDQVTSDGNGSYVLSRERLGSPDLDDPASIARHRQQVTVKPLGAELCVGCHRGFISPDMDLPVHLNGIDEPTFWRSSAYTGSGAGRVDAVAAKTCIDCHMAPEAASGDEYAAHGGQVASHRFVGGHTWMAAMRHDETQRAAVAARLEGAASIDVAAAYVTCAATPGDGDRCAAAARGPFLPADGAPVTPGSRLELDVVLRNLMVGHRFPGGVNDVQDTWIEVEIHDARGRRLAASGLAHAADVDDEEAHVLRSYVADQDGHILEAHELIGFRGAIANHTLAARDAATTRYAFDVPADLPAAALPLRVDARLRHRSRSLRLQRDACAAIDTPSGAAFRAGTRAARDADLDPCAPQPITEIAATAVWLGTGADDAAARAAAAGVTRAPTWQRLYEDGMGLLGVISERLDEPRVVLEAALAAAQAGADGAVARASVLAQLAAVAGRQGRTDDALALIARARELLPGDGPAVLDYVAADALARVWRWDEAARYAEAAATKAPLNTAAWIALARAHGSLHDDRAALDAARRGLAISPRDPDLLRSQATALRALDPALADQALAAYDRFRAPDGLAALRIACARRSARCAREREHGHTHVLTAPR